MSMNEAVGSVAALWRFPVKSMGGERLESVEVGERGIVGDRAFALIETLTGRVVSAKSAKLFPGVLNCKASYVEQPRLDGGAPAVQITLPDGTRVRSDSADVDRVLSDHFGRALRLARVAPPDFTIDQYHPDIEGASAPADREAVRPQPLGAALFAAMGSPSPVPEGSFFDVFPLSLLTTSTLARLGELQPHSRFDVRRFRMNIIVDAAEPGLVENDWIGRQLVLGGARIQVTLPDPRCVMTTLAQDELPQDNDILRALVRHNTVQVGDIGQFPCAGVYAVIGRAGTIRSGDRVALA